MKKTYHFFTDFQWQVIESLISKRWVSGGILVAKFQKVSNGLRKNSRVCK